MRQGNLGLQWVTVLSLSLLCIVSVALTHAEKPQAAVAAWSLVSPAMFVVLGVLALRENPFNPPISVFQTPLDAAAGCLSNEASPSAHP